MIRDEYGHAYPAPGPFWNLDEIKREHRSRGGYYFDTDTSRLFRARYAPEVYAGCMFVDSVRGPGMEREYRVKIIGTGRSVNTVADGFATLAAARAAAEKVCEESNVAGPDVDQDRIAHEWGSVES